MLFEFPQICTWNNEVEKGNIYLYTEGRLECKVKVLQIHPQPEGICLHLQVVAKPQHSPLALGEEWQVIAFRHQPDPSNWWYLHDQDLVSFPEEYRPPNNKPAPEKTSKEEPLFITLY